MKYTMNAQAVSVLYQILGVTGWAKTIEDVCNGGRIMASVLPKVEQGTPVRQPVEFEMTGPDRDLCKQAFQFGLSKEAIPASEWVTEICYTLEFVVKPKPLSA